MSSPSQAIRLKDLEEKINSIIEHYLNVKSYQIINGNIPESIYDLVEESNKYLLEIKELVGITNPSYDSLSTKLVLFSCGVVSDWTLRMSSLISIPVSGMRLGNSFLEVCDAVFKKIGEVEVNSITKRQYDETKYNYEVLKLQLSVHSKSKGGCFIATAAMGNYNHPVVVDLRNFRDDWLLKRNWGLSFTNWYYTHGPKAAKVINKSRFLKKLTFILVIKPLQIITKRLLK
jgi:hypothetical protein